ncbi:MAG: lipid-A-disaccharide synthase [Deltaproteobacteria bacterium]|nr:lipid-A-disaccharide synthase [Deltaproteobacteria bacterium]
MAKGRLRIMISAGEHSGDMHGAALVREASKSRPDMTFFGLGGDMMEAAGVELKAHLRETAVMGLTEVLGALGRVLKVRSLMTKLITSDRPDALVLIDSPDFNFTLAKAAHKAAVPVIYYICPQIWAWRPRRLNFLRDFTTRRALIFPFEADFYRQHNVQADLVGHPLLDELPVYFERQAILKDLGIEPGRPILAILPGSRKSVASKLAAPMLGAVDILLKSFPDLVAIVPRAAALNRSYLESLLSQASSQVKKALKVVDGRSQEILAVASAALLASGTSTVEGAVLGTPMVVTYRVSALSFWLARLLVKVPFVSIANLVAKRQIVPELLQSRCRADELALAIAPLITESSTRKEMIDNLKAVASSLGGPGASARVLELIDRAIGDKSVRT